MFTNNKLDIIYAMHWWSSDQYHIIYLYSIVESIDLFKPKRWAIKKVSYHIIYMKYFCIFIFQVNLNRDWIIILETNINNIIHNKLLLLWQYFIDNNWQKLYLGGR